MLRLLYTVAAAATLFRRRFMADADAITPLTPLMLIID